MAALTYTVTVTLKNGQTQSHPGVTQAQLDAWSVKTIWTANPNFNAIQCSLDQ